MPTPSKLMLLSLMCWQAQSWMFSVQFHNIDGSRRSLLSSLIGVQAIFLAPNSRAETLDERASQELVSADRLGDLLRAVPTFTIVDTNGIPYVVVGEDAKVTGYFFTTYGEADRILRLARTSADKMIRDQQLRQKEAAYNNDDDEIGPNPWSSAQISSVPLDFAVTMASKSAPGAYFKVAPAEKDIDDALVLIGKSDIPEGKVPLFYMEDFIIKDPAGVNQRPMFFHKSQLLKSWIQSNKDAKVPKVQVTELFRVLNKMLEANGTDLDLREIVFVAPEESSRMARECSRRVKGESFQFGKRIVVL